MNVAEKFAEAVKEKLNELCWYCRHCPKISECEEQTSKEGFEPRYCRTIIEAAILNRKDFIQPFERV
jgi:hypothetical protein